MSLIRTIIATGHFYYSKFRFGRDLAFAKQPGRLPHVMLVSWAFPPHTASSSHFPKALAEATSPDSLFFSVICAPAPTNPITQGLELLSTLPAWVDVRRVPGSVDITTNNPKVRPSFSLVPELDGGFDTAVSMARTAIENFQNNAPDVVIAQGPRFSNFVAAHYIAKWSGAKLILFYMDEWCVNSPPFVSATISDHEWEKRCLSEADAVAYVTEGKRRAYETVHPILKTKRQLVCPNGWDPVGFDKAQNVSNHLNEFTGKFCISFLGVAAPTVPIKPFLVTLGMVLDRRPDLGKIVRIILVGKQPENVLSEIKAFSARHPDIINMRPPVPHSQAIEILRESNAALLLNTGRYDGIVPQKTYDYLNVNTPILCYGETGGATSIVKDAHAGISVPSDSASELENALDELVRSPKSRWIGTARDTLAKNSNRHNLAREFLRFSLDILQ